MLTGTICAQCLCDKHGERFRGRKEPFSMSGQQSFNFIKQRIAGEKIERAQAITFMSLSLDESLLGTNGDGGMMHATGTWGWWMVWRFEA
jgi:hypothetical protein